jgi:hypothetical protein
MSNFAKVLHTVLFSYSFVANTVSEKSWKKPGVKLWPARA